MHEVAQCRSCHEEEGYCRGAERQTDLELVEACKLERGAKGLLDPGAGDVDAVDLVEQQMDHVANRHKAANEPGADRTEPEQVIGNRGVEEQEEEGGKLRMKDASVHGELGEYLVEHMADKEIDRNPEDR